MQRGKGRPARKRTDAELVDYLDLLLGSGRKRCDVELHWDGHQLVISAGPMDEGRTERSRGLDVRSALTRASIYHSWKVKPGVSR